LPTEVKESSMRAKTATPRCYRATARTLANGGDGADTFIDDDGDDDVLNGEDGNDDIRVANGDDTVDCGAGTSDQALVDADDMVIDCETVITP
jgi:hypothetical protein